MKVSYQIHFNMWLMLINIFCCIGIITSSIKNLLLINNEVNFVFLEFKTCDNGFKIYFVNIFIINFF